MKRRILALALALGMLFGSTLSVSAAPDMPVNFKKCTGAEFVDPVDAANAASMSRVFGVMTGSIKPSEHFGGWSDYQATLDYINNAGK